MKSYHSTALLLLGSMVCINAAFTAIRHEQMISHLSRICQKKDTALFMGDNNHRARTERDLEDMMGNDWRFFRARLVAQEQSESSDPNTNQERQEEHIGNFFVGAISSIFQNKNGREHENQNKSYFCDDGIGVIEDPFASESEIIASALQPEIDISKHRWAHPISHLEKGCVLIANEKLGGVFHQTVVLIIEHHEATGSTGIVINRPFQEPLLKVASETNSNVDLSLKLAFNSATVSYGGPVMQEEFSLLHGYGEVDGAKKVAPGVFVGGSRELKNEVRRNRFSSNDALFVKGHAAWVPSQLSREISKGVWYIASASPDLILRYAGAPVRDGDNANDLWSDILSSMGGKYSEVAQEYAGKGDLRMMP